jgi:tetratricopeptide (TPR) repeat protein
MGRLDQAQPLIDEALALSRRVGSRWAEAVAVLDVSFLSLEQGRFGEALRSASEGERLGVHAGFTGILSFTSAIRALIYRTLGDIEKARQAARDARDAVVDTPWAIVSRLTSDLLLDDLSNAPSLSTEEVTDIVQEMEAEGKNRYLESMFIVGGHALMRRGLFERAAGFMDRAIAIKEQRSIVIGLPDLYYIKARALMALGRHAESRSALEQGRAISERYGLRRALWRLLGDLAAYEEAAGETEAAQRDRATARDVVAYIAEHAGSPDLTASFLATRDVQAVLAD